AGASFLASGSSPLARQFRPEHFLLTLQKFIAIFFLAAFIVPVALRLIVLPDQVGVGTFAAGGFNGWLALALTIAAVIAFNKLAWRSFSVTLLAQSLLAAGSLIAFRVARFGVAGWAGLHVLLAALIFVPWFLLFLKDLPKVWRGDEPRWVTRFFARVGLRVTEDWADDTVLFASLIGGGTVLVAVRGPFSDPQGAWWSIASLLSVCVLAAALHWITFHRAYLYAAGILLNLSVSIWLIKYPFQALPSLTAFVEANVIALSLAGIVWLLLDLRARRLHATARSNTAVSFHNVAALGSLFALAIVVTARLSADFGGFYQTFFLLLDWTALVSSVVLMAACLWDRHAEY